MSRQATQQALARELRDLSSEIAGAQPAIAERLEAVADRLREHVLVEPAGYVSTGEAATALGVSPNTVKKWVRLGYVTDVWALPGSGYLKIARSEMERIRAAGTPKREAKG